MSPLLSNIHERGNRQPTTSGLLSTRAEIHQRNQEKTFAVLRFLRTTIYSTTDILAQVMNLKTKSAIWKTLQSMERKRLLRSQMFEAIGGRFTLWGITPAGQEAALQSGDDPSHVFFNVSKVSLHGLQHYLSLQQIRVAAERENWSKFSYCDRCSPSKGMRDHSSKHSLRPDLIATDPSGRRVAIESERTLKRPTRYKEHVIPGHVRRLNSEDYEYVVWVCRHTEDEKTLRSFLTTAIQELTKEKTFYLDKTTSGVKPFNITSLTAWPKF